MKCGSSLTGVLLTLSESPGYFQTPCIDRRDRPLTRTLWRVLFAL
jgi:hypothetical protein